ncbi:MAG: ABC transporter ATP-binding protein [Lachnospiraceae bacterium]|jgi:ABC-type multidrug transport system fused ATPase/permease subunit|nr:ABC transporter ATP-binding protein [Lachnospiraceae bacterium]
MDMIKKMRYILDRRQKMQICFLGMLIFVGGLLETVSVSGLLPVVWVIIDPAKAQENKYVRVLMEVLHTDSIEGFIVPLLTAMILLYTLKNAFLLLLANEQNKFIAHNRNKLISQVLREFLNRPYEFYLDADIPTVFRLTDSDIPNVFNILMAMISLVSEAVVFALLCVVMVATDWKLLVFLIVVFGCLSVLILKVMKPRLSRLGEKNLAIQSRIAKWRIQAIYGIKDVKVLHREAFFADNYESSGKIGAGYSKRYAVMNNTPRLLIETIFIASILGYIILYILAGNDASTLVPILTAFGVAAIRMMPSVNRINTYMTDISYFRPCLDYVYENMNINEISKKNNQTLKPVDATKTMALRDRIELRDIVYAYPNTDKLIFDHADMVIPCGKSVGIMGPSGAGKSTIVDILLGLLKVRTGSILCDGVDIFDNYPAWLSRIGYIPQSIYLVDEPIRNNIAFGIADSEIDDARIWDALEEAQLAAFIRGLPEGLDTAIGDRGVRLSGGQRQRLGIARALYHNPEILVFDEATSALDNETEAAVMDAINSFHGRKTMIIIAHRLNTIEKCDMIYKVDAGKITRTVL